MSTNFYADWKISENITMRMHIGKRTSSGISTFHGSTFPTVKAWTTFLEHNVLTVTVVDEYGTVHNTHDFIRDEIDAEPLASTSQKKWLTDNGYTIHDKPVPSMPGQPHAYWHDRTRLFTNGNFC